MKKWYGLIKDGVLVQKQPNKEKGFVEIPEAAVCGQLYSNKKFANPKPSETPYYEKRKKEYQKIGDQLDALWKIINQWRLEGKSLPQEGDDILNQILSIKKNHPKPKE